MAAARDVEVPHEAGRRLRRELSELRGQGASQELFTQFTPRTAGSCAQAAAHTVPIFVRIATVQINADLRGGLRGLFARLHPQRALGGRRHGHARRHGSGAGLAREPLSLWWDAGPPEQEEVAARLSAIVSRGRGMGHPEHAGLTVLGFSIVGAQ